MRRIDYAEVTSLISRQTGRIVELDATSFAILLDALSEIEHYGNWRDGDDKLSDAQWDIVQGWVALAIHQLLTVYDCEEEEPPEGGEMSYAIIRDEKASGTQGGSSQAATWLQRDFNTIVSDIDSLLVSLTANAFVLIEGVFRIRALTPARNCSDHRNRLWNVTQASLVKEGNNNRTTSAIYAGLDCVVTSNGSDSLRIDHYCDLTVANNGLGLAMFLGSNEVYSSVVIEEL